MFQLNNCAATITSVNPRKENHGDEKSAAFDINFQLNVHAECVKGLYSDEFMKAMWKPDGKELMINNIMKIVLDDVFEHGAITIKESTGHETVYNDCKLKSFKIRPCQFQMVELWFQIQYQPDSENEITPAFRCLKLDKGVQITVEAQIPDHEDEGDAELQTDAFPNGAPEETEPEEDDEGITDHFEGSDLGEDDFPAELGGNQ